MLEVIQLIFTGFIISLMMFGSYYLVSLFLKATDKKKKHQRELSEEKIELPVNTSQKIGDEGEKLVAAELSKVDPRAVVMNNFTFYNNGISVQIDHVMVSKKGIFIVETKTWNCEAIDGDADSKEWEIVYKNNTFKVMNPVKQNEWHINSLREVSPDLRKFKIRNLVVITGTGYYRQLQKSGGKVTLLKYLMSFLSKTQEVMTEEEVKQSLEILFTIKEKISREEHIDNLSKYKKN